MERVGERKVKVKLKLKERKRERERSLKTRDMQPHRFGWVFNDMQQTHYTTTSINVLLRVF